MKLKSTITAISFALILTTCGTTPADRTGAPIDRVINTLNGEPVIPRRANTIYIEPFLNRTAQPDIHDRLHAMLNKHITDDGRLAITTEKTMADLLLRGIIVQYMASPVTFTDFGRPEKVRLLIAMNIMLVDLKKDRVILQNSGVQAFRTFSEIKPPVETEFQARERLIESLAKRLLSMIASGWYTDQMTPVEKGKK